MNRPAALAVAAAALAVIGSACASSAGTSRPPYEAEATRACFKKRPEYVPAPPFKTIRRLEVYVLASTPYGRRAAKVFMIFFPPGDVETPSTTGEVDFLSTEVGARRLYSSEYPYAQRASHLSHIPLRWLLLQRRNVVIRWKGIGADRYDQIILDCLRT
jgi:hypothetical protein